MPTHDLNYNCMPGFWMVRAGEGGYLAKEFVEKECVAVGFDGVGSFEQLTTLGAFKGRLLGVYPDDSPGKRAGAAGVGHKFRTLVQRGDRILTYDPDTRLYHLGRVEGDYEYRPGFVSDYSHVRRVKWDRQILRDTLSSGVRNTLGSTLTLFEPGDAILQEMLRSGVSAETPAVLDEEDRGDETTIYLEQLSRSHEFIADRVNRLSPHEMEQLLAALLRTMGFKARVTLPGPDRGRDVVASPDGLGLQSPRIFCEVKHRKGSIGAPEVRSFTSTLRGDDRGLFLSTGGFTREAKYEGDRSHVPVTLVDLEELVRLVVEHYEQFDTVGRALIPLDRVY
ncbi:restriction endonuclease [Gemmatimonas aurantiaca]|nr:restriction endonuclease [Gemmatimonas aurantiaca]